MLRKESAEHIAKVRSIANDTKTYTLNTGIRSSRLLCARHTESHFPCLAGSPSLKEFRVPSKARHIPNLAGKLRQFPDGHGVASIRGVPVLNKLL